MPGATDNTGTLQQLLSQEMAGLQQPQQGGGIGDVLGGLGQAAMMAGMAKRGRGRGGNAQLMQLLMGQQAMQQKQQGNERNQKLDNVRQLVGTISQIEQTNMLRQQQAQAAQEKIMGRQATQQFWSGIIKRGGPESLNDPITLMKIFNEEVGPELQDYLPDGELEKAYKLINENKRVMMEKERMTETRRQNDAQILHWNRSDSVAAGNNAIQQQRLSLENRREVRLASEASEKKLNEGPIAWIAYEMPDGTRQDLPAYFTSKFEMQNQLPVLIARSESNGVPARVISAPLDREEQSARAMQHANMKHYIDGIMKQVVEGKALNEPTLKMLEANIGSVNDYLQANKMAPLDLTRKKDPKYWLGTAGAWFGLTTQPEPTVKGVEPRTSGVPAPSVAPPPAAPVAPVTPGTSAAPSAAPVTPGTSGKRPKLGPNGKPLALKTKDPTTGQPIYTPLYEED